MVKKMFVFTVLSALLLGCSANEKTELKTEQTEEKSQVNEKEKEKFIAEFTQYSVPNGPQYGINKRWIVFVENGYVTSIKVDYFYQYVAMTPMIIPKEGESQEDYMKRVESETSIDSQQRVQDYMNNLDTNGFYNQKVEGVEETHQLIDEGDDLYYVRINFIIARQSDIARVKEFGDDPFRLSKYSSWDEVTYQSLYETYFQIENVSVSEIHE